MSLCTFRIHDWRMSFRFEQPRPSRYRKPDAYYRCARCGKTKPGYSA